MNRLDHVDELLSRLSAPPPLRAEQIARIRAAIDDDRPARRVPRLALAIALCVALCGFAAAAVYGITKTSGFDAAPVPSEPPKPAPVVASSPHQRAPHATLPPPAVIATTVTPPQPPSIPKPARIATPERVHGPARIDAPASRRSDPPPVSSISTPITTPSPSPTIASVPSEPSDDALAAESQLVATSLRQLRKERAPKAALETLDRYSAEFPHGVLSDEARATRVEALVALGERHAALELLDGMTVGTELGVVRGELRLAASRYADAAADFTAALVGARDDLEARALFGRAACRIRLRDPEGARADLASYLARFPRGSQAAAASTALEQIDRDRNDR
jgi:hypothetical protein